MAKRKKTITLTEEHIALISNVKFEKFAPVESEGVVWEQHYEDSTNTYHAGVRLEKTS